MKAGLPALLLLLATQAGAQSFVSMGRLFTTPSERAHLDSQRSQALSLAPGTPSAPGQAAIPGIVPGVPPEPYSAAGAAPPGMPPAAPAGGMPAEQATPAPGLRLDGIVRRSNGPDMIIVNGEVQPAPARGVLRGAVRLQADGRSVTLKPGQRYDPDTGAVHEAAR
ncbi:MAG: hypothetical protein K0R43_3321 [Pseudoduganella sp.]|jgi:hypothetical protein|nr:hypothetical protein [Pseudoduganella sp.]